MELENDDDGWRNEMRKYTQSVQNLTETALKRIKRERIRKNLPFDKAFQTYFLHKTNARIANAYTDFLLDENCEGGQSHFNQDVNQRSANGNENILEMPVVLEQLNNHNASAPFKQNDNYHYNEMSEPMVIFIPSNPLTSPQNLEQESYSRSARTNVPVANGAKDGTNMERLIGSEPNSGNGNRSSVRDRPVMQSASTSVNSVEFHKSLGRIVDLNINQSETIDLTSDGGEANGVTGSEQSGSTVVNVRLQGKCPSIANKNYAHMKSRMMTSKSQIESSHTKQKMGRDVHANELLLPNVVTESNASQHSVTSNNANDAVTNNHDGLELATDNGVATPPKVNDTQQIGLIALSDIKTEFNSHETTSDMARAYSNEEGSQRLDVISSLNLQYPESIDLISDDEEAVNLAVNIFPKDGNASGFLKKKSKLANKRTVDTKKRHKCDFCEYSTDIKSHLNVHIRTHTNARPHRCEVCEKRFSHKFNLIRHMKTHRDMFAFQCSKCRQGFSDQKLWKLHESHCNVRGYECHLCKQFCSHKQELADHMRKHTGEKLRCPKCRKKFSSNHSLARHIKSHGKLFRFHCSNCRQGFSKKKPWKVHESRCKSKQYECFLCGKKFHQEKGNLLRHMRYKHTGEKPFGCSDCPLRFCSKSNLTRHTNSHH